MTLLLKAASRDGTDLALEDFQAHQIRWAVETGLGPLLQRAIADDPKARTSALWPFVQGADLTARVISGQQLDAMDEIIRVCQGHAPPLTLLKGISVCSQHYPEPHLRVMRDVDVLVDQEAIPTVESRLLRLGYLPRSENPPAFYETHHHTTPFFHPRTRVWVEVHRGLFPSASELGADRVFGLENIRAELRPSEFHGRRVNRLSDELQLVYLASHWAFGLKRVGGVVGVLDAVYLLTNARALRWERVLGWLDGAVASAYVYLLLTYLGRHRLVDVSPGVLSALRARQQSFGRANLKALQAIIDRYVTGGREFGALMSARNFEIIRKTLLSPGRPTRNALRLLWNLLPSRVGLRNLLPRVHASA